MADGMRDLPTLLKEMQPHLHYSPYDFVVVDSVPAGVFAAIHEEEALTVVIPAATGDWARISLTIHSSLSAIGLSATIAKSLADNDIPCNIIAGYYHDHLFVPWPRRHDALAALATLSETAA